MTANDIKEEGAKDVAQVLANNNTLKTLSIIYYAGIGWNRIGYEGIKAIALALTHNNSLKWIDISGNSLEDNAIEEIANVLKYNKTLATLGNKYYKVMSGIHIGSKKIKVIAKALTYNNTLTEIGILLYSNAR